MNARSQKPGEQKPGLRALLAGLAAAAVLATGACSDSDKAEPSTANTTRASTVDTASAATVDTSASPEASSAPPSESASAASSAASSAQGKFTDASLQKALSGIDLGTPSAPVPVSAVRGQDKSILPQTDPRECAFAAKGLAEPIIDGKPAALQVAADQSAGASLVDMGSEAEAKKLLAERDKMLDNPKCASITMVGAQGGSATTIKEKKTAGYGLEDARIMVSSAKVDGKQVTQQSILGRKGTVLVQVQVPEGKDSAQEAAVKKVLTDLEG